MRVAVFGRRWIKVTREGQQRVKRCKEKRLCTSCLKPLGDQKPIRGQHPTSCYHVTYDLIASGKVTEAELIEAGHILPKATPGRKPTNPTAIQFASN